MLVRCTARLIKVLDAQVHADDHPGCEEWYANLLWIERRKCVLVMHAPTLFAVVIPDVRARELRPIGPLLVRHIGLALAAENVPQDTLGPLDRDRVRIAMTSSRHLLGHLGETAHTCRYAVEAAGGLEEIDVPDLNRTLARQLHHVSGEYQQPLELLHARASA